MSRIRGKGNRSTEVALLHLLRMHHLTGWRRHLPLPGKPDFAFPREKVAIFVDGCFWHGCPNCSTVPTTRREFWVKKISENKRRDRRVSRALRSKGWSVVRIWECRLRKYPEAQIRRVERVLGR